MQLEGGEAEIWSHVLSADTTGLESNDAIRMGCRHAKNSAESNGGLGCRSGIEDSFRQD